MTIKVTYVDDYVQFFETDKYVLSTIKDFHPNIVKVEVFAGNKKVFTKKRMFGLIYKKLIYKSKKVQEKLKEITKQEEKENGNQSEND